MKMHPMEPSPGVNRRAEGIPNNSGEITSGGEMAHCAFWLRDRKRYCHMPNGEGGDGTYCYFHSPNTTKFPCPHCRK